MLKKDSENKKIEKYKDRQSGNFENTNVQTS